eukprot:12925550-Prorocentrum_lima.AAC.1
MPTTRPPRHPTRPLPCLKLLDLYLHRSQSRLEGAVLLQGGHDCCLQPFMTRLGLLQPFWYPPPVGRG